MQKLIALLLALIIITSCKDDVIAPAFNEDELTPLVTFEVEGKLIELTSNNSNTFSFPVSSESGSVLPETYAFLFSSDFSASPSCQNTAMDIELTKWFDINELEFLNNYPIDPGDYPNTSKFLEAFESGDRDFQKDIDITFVSDEITISYVDEDLSFYASYYGNNPSSKFHIIKSMALSDGTAIVEGTFDVTLYSIEGESINLENGYLRAIFQRANTIVEAEPGEEVDVTLEFELNAADELDDSEYIIYNLILDSMYDDKDVSVNQKSRIHFLNNVEPYKSNLKNEFSDFDNSLFDNYLFAAISYAYFDDVLIETLISEEELTYLFNKTDECGNKTSRTNGWDRFEAKNPDLDGYIDFTRVGFNEDKTQGLLEISYNYGSLGAEGYLIYVRKDAKGWKIAKVILEWIS